MNRKLSLLILILSVAGGISTLQGCQKAVVNVPTACSQEAKLCPDGSAVGRTGPNCTFAPCPQIQNPDVAPVNPNLPVVNPKPTGDASDNTVEFGEPIVMRIADMFAFPDGMVLTLKEIGDSRCPKGVQCIWQGELSPLFVSTANGTSDEIRLGTVRQESISLKGHTYQLEAATEDSATVRVSLENGTN